MKVANKNTTKLSISRTSKSKLILKPDFRYWYPPKELKTININKIDSIKKTIEEIVSPKGICNLNTKVSPSKTRMIFSLKSNILSMSAKLPVSVF